MKRLVVATVAALFVPALALAGSTPRDQYVRRVTKIAPPTSAKPKGLCACQNGLDQGQVGYLRQGPGTFGALAVSCEIPGFDADGNVVGGTSCDTFVPLMK
jgi:hypothetical protein